jgi:tRNA(fMet)-specific endonuclease VapC
VILANTLFARHEHVHLGAYDVLLAGYACYSSLTLVTANTAEFSRVPGLNLENWHLTAK